MTFAAQVLTLPILIYNFGQFSIVSPITNILLVPLLPLVMIFGFVFVLLGIVWHPIAALLSIPCYLLLSYLIFVVDLMSSFSFSALFFEISWWWIIC